MLRTIVQLEVINRGSIFHRILEKLAVRVVPSIVIKLDASLGLAQIKVSNAKEYFHYSPRRYLSEMLKPEISIDLCAYMLKQLIESN